MFSSLPGISWDDLRMAWRMLTPPTRSAVKLEFFFVGKFIELDDGKIYRKALYLMVKTMVSCRFSLKPIQWEILGNDTFGWGRAPLSEQVLSWLWRHQHRRQANPFPLPGWVSLFSVLLQGIKCKRMALYSVYWWLYHYIRLNPHLFDG